MASYFNRRTAFAQNTVFVIPEKISSKLVDRYALNFSLGLQEIGYSPKVITSTFEDSRFNMFTLLDIFDFTVYNTWIPSKICGLFSNTMTCIKSMWLALKLALIRPVENAQLVFTDMNMLAVIILKFLTNYKVIYVKNFLTEPMFSLNKSTVLKPTWLEAFGLKFLDGVIVATPEIGDALMNSRYGPVMENRARALYPTIDIDISISVLAGISSLIPDIKPDMKIFLTIGKFCRSSNFELAVKAFELLLQDIGEVSVIENFVLVVAGYCKSQEEERYFKEISAQTTTNARIRSSGTHVRFIRLEYGMDEKLLIQRSLIVIHPAENDVFSDFLVKSMSFSKPIVATDNGIASKLLVHGTSGVIVTPQPHVFSSIFMELLHNQDAFEMLGREAHRVFQERFSFKKFTEDLELIIRDYA